MATTRTLYVDSSKCTGTGSYFAYSLRQSVDCPTNAAAVIEDLIVPNTFQTVDIGRQYLYVTVTVASVNLDTRAELPVGHCNGISLATATAAALN